jgi:hypothetical protein
MNAQKLSTMALTICINISPLGMVFRHATTACQRNMLYQQEQDKCAISDTLYWRPTL